MDRIQSILDDTVKSWPLWQTIWKPITQADSPWARDDQHDRSSAWVKCRFPCISATRNGKNNCVWHLCRFPIMCSSRSRNHIKIPTPLYPKVYFVRACHIPVPRYGDSREIDTRCICVSMLFTTNIFTSTTISPIINIVNSSIYYVREN